MNIIEKSKPNLVKKGWQPHSPDSGRVQVSVRGSVRADSHGQLGAVRGPRGIALYSGVETRKNNGNMTHNSGVPRFWRNGGSLKCYIFSCHNLKTSNMYCLTCVRSKMVVEATHQRPDQVRFASPWSWCWEIHRWGHTGGKPPPGGFGNLSLVNTPGFWVS